MKIIRNVEKRWSGCGGIGKYMHAIQNWVLMGPSAPSICISAKLNSIARRRSSSRRLAFRKNWLKKYFIIPAQFFLCVLVQNRTLNDLVRLLSDSEVNYTFIKSRISRLFSKWAKSIKDLQMRVPDLWNRSQLNVFIHSTAKETNRL